MGDQATAVDTGSVRGHLVIVDHMDKTLSTFITYLDACESKGRGSQELRRLRRCLKDAKAELKAHLYDVSPTT